MSAIKLTQWNRSGWKGAPAALDVVFAPSCPIAWLGSVALGSDTVRFQHAFEQSDFEALTHFQQLCSSGYYALVGTSLLHPKRGVAALVQACSDLNTDDVIVAVSEIVAPPVISEDSLSIEAQEAVDILTTSSIGLREIFKKVIGMK